MEKIFELPIWGKNIFLQYGEEKKKARMEGGEKNTKKKLWEFYEFELAFYFLPLNCVNEKTVLN